MFGDYDKEKPDAIIPRLEVPIVPVDQIPPFALRVPLNDVHRMFYNCLYKTVPVGFRDITFANLDTFRDRFPSINDVKFKELLRILKEYPRLSFLITGPTGKGKTTFLTALFHYALFRWSDLMFRTGESTEAVFSANTTALAQQFIEWSVRDKSHSLSAKSPEVPAVTIGKINAALNKGLTPRLFLDDIDKFKPTEFMNNSFCGIIDLVYANAGQLVATSTLSSQALAYKLGPQYGEFLVRRFTDKPNGGVLLDFTEFDVNIKIN